MALLVASTVQGVDAFIVPTSSIVTRRPSSEKNLQDRPSEVWNVDGEDNEGEYFQINTEDNSFQRQRHNRVKAAGVATALAAGTAMALNVGDMHAAMAIPTAFVMPWPSGPVVVSTPKPGSYSG